MQSKYNRRGESACRRCRKVKPLSEFPPNPLDAKRGISRVCRECTTPGAVSWSIKEASDGNSMVCRTCKAEKPKAEFFRKGPRSSGYYATQCASCSLHRMAFREEFDARILTVGDRTCPGCKQSKPITEFHIQRSRPDGRSSKCIACVQKRKKELAESKKSLDNRRWHVHRAFQITLQEFDSMLAAQNGLCAICGVDLEYGENSGKRINLDHDHATGAIREILCHPCNTKLGAVESPGFLKRALEYLKKHGADPLSPGGY